MKHVRAVAADLNAARRWFAPGLLIYAGGALAIAQQLVGALR